MPSFGSTSSAASALRASADEVENPVSSTGVVANVATATRSFARLRPQERLRGGDRVAERLARHRLRAVDREDDALRAAEVLREERADGPAVLEQPRAASTVGDGVTTLARMVGYALASTPLSSTPALAEPAKRRGRERAPER